MLLGNSATLQKSNCVLLQCLSDPVEKSRLPPTILVVLDEWWNRSMHFVNNRGKKGFLNCATDAGLNVTTSILDDKVDCQVITNNNDSDNNKHNKENKNNNNDKCNDKNDEKLENSEINEITTMDYTKNENEINCDDENVNKSSVYSMLKCTNEMSSTTITQDTYGKLKVKLIYCPTKNTNLKDKKSERILDLDSREIMHYSGKVN